MGKGRKVWKITESPHVINLINRVEKKRRIYIYKEEKGNPKAAKIRNLRSIEDGSQRVSLHFEFSKSIHGRKHGGRKVGRFKLQFFIVKVPSR